MPETSPTSPVAAHDPSAEVLKVHLIKRWWRANIARSVAHQEVMARVADESGWSGRFAFMTVMSAGIAVLGLLLSSPAVVIGAMLISPLMGPIMGLGFSLALFDFAEMRRSLTALIVAAALAIGFTALVVLCSPLKAATSEILARTRPNLFDLLVALFSALAGAVALIRGRGETIVGVAIATALMPPLATVGYGLATANFSIAGGAFALFATNFVTITLSATIMARLYGFAHRLSAHQSWLQTILLLGTFVVMAVPLAISLNRIAREAVVATQVRNALNGELGKSARVTQLDIDYGTRPLIVRAVIILPKSKAVRAHILASHLEAKLGQRVSLQVGQVFVDPTSAAVDQEKAALAQAQEQQQLRAEGTEVSRLVAVAAGVDPNAVVLDRDSRRAFANAHALPGATLATYMLLERRIAGQAPGWSIILMPPAGLDLPSIRFADGSDQLDDDGKADADVIAWAVKRWNWAGLSLPGLVEPPSAHPALDQRRAAAITATLRNQGILIIAGKALRNAGVIRLTPVPTLQSVR